MAGGGVLCFLEQRKGPAPFCVCAVVHHNRSYFASDKKLLLYSYILCCLLISQTQNCTDVKVKMELLKKMKSGQVTKKSTR